MSSLWDFLTFKTFIAQDVLIVCYWLGAIVLPVVLFALRGAVFRRIAPLQDAQAKLNRSRYAGWVYAVMFAMFVCAEIVWRMMFEAMIAYFQMHDALVR